MTVFLNLDENFEEVSDNQPVVDSGLEEASLEAPSDESVSDSENQEKNQNIPETSDFSNWYTLRVVSGKEKFVKENIFRELDFSPELKSKINEIFVPFEKIVVIKNDKKKIKERMFFPDI